MSGVINVGEDLEEGGVTDFATFISAALQKSMEQIARGESLQTVMRCLAEADIQAELRKEFGL